MTLWTRLKYYTLTAPIVMLFNEETIEAYVSGQMTGADKALFEADMAKDPLLTREVEIQKDIHSGLQNHRRMELKQRLNNIDMSTATINLGTKVAASVLISMIVGGGLYLAINMTEQPQAVAVQTTTGKNTKVEKAPVAIAPAAAQTVAPQAQNNAPAVAAAPQVQRTAAVQPNSNIIFELPTVDVPANGDVSTSGNGSTPNADLVNGKNVTELENVSVKVDVAKDKNGGYSYQYYNNKLFLYGDFNSADAVNILEFNKGGKKQLFVYTNKQYYQIKNNQTEIAPLKVIKDQSTINQLNNR